MPYRGLDTGRIARQLNDRHLQQAGQTATWRQFISASAGVSVAGFDATPFYREQTITGLFHVSLTGQGEQQTPAGVIDAATLVACTPQPLGLRDELLWNGDVWHVESDSYPLAGQWRTHLRKGI